VAVLFQLMLQLVVLGLQASVCRSQIGYFGPQMDDLGLKRSQSLKQHMHFQRLLSHGDKFTALPAEGGVHAQSPRAL